jgi:hypothetical protein
MVISFSDVFNTNSRIVDDLKQVMGLDKRCYLCCGISLSDIEEFGEGGGHIERASHNLDTKS